MNRFHAIRPLFKALLTGLGCLLLLSGCLEKQEPITTRIGIALGPRQNTWDAATVEYGTVRAASYTLPYYLTNAADSAAQASQLQNMARDTTNVRGWHCEVIILTSINQPAEVLSRFINDDKVRIILYETPVEIDYTCLVTGDNTQAGNLAAAFVLGTFEDGTTPRILTLEAPGSRYAARLEAFRSAVGVQTIDSLVKAPTDSLAKKMTKSALDATDGTSINAVYTADDDMALGVLDALTETGNTQIRVIVGCGGKQKFLQKITEITYPALATATYPADMLEECVDIAYKLAIQGQQPESREIHHPSVLIDVSNVTQHIDSLSYY